MSKEINGVAAVSPLVKQETIVSNLNQLVGQGIAFDVEQRAFLMSIKDKIATTFNVADASLLKLVRIQQQDTTAARLGMESALTSFLNNMYETTEYMQGVASNVRSSLLEAESLMGAKSAAAFEYQVQKWMGSLYSVGASDSAVQSIAGAIGQIASGNISGLNGSGAGNLVIMAANNAGLSLAEMLQKGLDESETNRLMTAMVNYLGGIYNETTDSRVVQQQFANIFGLTAADLKAAANLSGTVENIAKSNLTYNGMLGQLTSMANSMYLRTSIGELLSNAFSNIQYGLATNIANSPALYSTYKIASLLDATTGGISLPDVMTPLGGVALHTTVADVMRAGALGGSMLSGIGNLISMIGSGGGLLPSGMLKAMGINTGTDNIVTYGNGKNLVQLANSTSESGYVGNGEGGDVYNATMQSAEEQKAQVQPDEEEDNTKLKDINSNVELIYNLLFDITTGARSLAVHYDMERP